MKSESEYPHSETTSDMSVTVDLSVDDDVFIKVAAVGSRVATDLDYFSIGVRHILRDKYLKEDEPQVEESE